MGGNDLIKCHLCSFGRIMWNGSFFESVFYVNRVDLVDLVDRITCVDLVDRVDRIACVDLVDRIAGSAGRNALGCDTAVFAIGDHYDRIRNAFG